MLFFEKGSVFTAVPAALRDDQRVWFDAVRGTCESAEVSYRRLQKALSNPTLYGTQGKTEIETNEILSDAFSFVDSAQRLRKLFNVVGRFFGHPPSSVEVKRPPPRDGYRTFKTARKVFESKLAGLVDVRDGAQHLEDKLKMLATMRAPVWGAMEWIAVIPTGQKQWDIHFCSILPGYIYNGAVTPEIDLDAPIAPLANRIRMRAHGRKLDLTEIRNAMEAPIQALDTLFKPQFEGLPRMAVSIFTRFFAPAPSSTAKLEPTGTGA